MLLDQCLQRLSDRYLPDNSWAWMVAMAILEGEDPADVHKGCGETRDIKRGLKNVREEYLGSSASSRRCCSQKSRTFFLMSFLKADLGGGKFRRSRGWSRSYLVQRPSIPENQDLAGGGVPLLKALRAIVCSRHCGSLEIMPKIFSWLQSYSFSGTFPALGRIEKLF